MRTNVVEKFIETYGKTPTKKELEAFVSWFVRRNKLEPTYKDIERLKKNKK